MSDDDLIRRGDVLALPHRLSPSLDADDGYFVSVDAIRALPAADLERAMSDICTWPSCKCTAKGQCEGLGHRILAPTFTAADLERAWEMGRDAVQVVFLQPCGTVRVRRPKNPPADLAQRVKE